MTIPLSLPPSTLPIPQLDAAYRSTEDYVRIAILGHATVVGEGELELEREKRAVVVSGWGGGVC